ncbi:MAG: bifunctional riboflavin kinase/FAD synthetase [bacterium]|nr:bifunctional riboflavin kinase/FAD synthetase [bacterium]
MQVIHDALRSADLPYGVVATIGNYDGIHRGQRAVIGRVVERARELGVPAVAISFHPHPLTVLRPESAPQLLTPGVLREQLLAEAGLDALLLIRFTHELARTEAEEFVRKFLHEQLAVREIIVGSGFMFGHRRRGDVELLRSMGERLGFTTGGVEEVLHRGELISSTRIRRAITEGRVEAAMELLGRPYGLRGTVGRGDRMGMRLGWPTINLMTDNQHLPGDGVYTGRAFFPSFPATFDCVTNVGTRPTVYENYHHVVESHILDFNSDVYGEEVEVRFYKRLREERMFPTVMDLSAQIGRDVEATREYFAARRRLQGKGDDAQ